MLPGIVKTSPRSAIVIDSRRSTPSSKLYGPYSAEILRMPCGPNRVPERYVVPPSNGTPRTATSYSPHRRTSSTYGALRKVLMPAKCGSSPRLNVGIAVDDRVGALQAQLQAAGDLPLAAWSSAARPRPRPRSAPRGRSCRAAAGAASPWGVPSGVRGGDGGSALHGARPVLGLRETAGATSCLPGFCPAVDAPWRHACPSRTSSPPGAAGTEP